MSRNEIRADVIEKKDDGVMFYYLIIKDKNDNRMATIECFKQDADLIAKKINAQDTIEVIEGMEKEMKDSKDGRWNEFTLSELKRRLTEGK